MVCEWRKSGKVHIHNQAGKELGSIQPPGGVVLWDVACTASNIYISEYNDKGTGRVYIYNHNHNLLNTLQVNYKGHGGLAFTDKYLYVTSSRENKVYRLNMPDGGGKQTFIHSDAGLNNPQYIAADHHHVAVSCYSNHKVFIHDTQGRCLHVYGGGGSGPGQLQYPWSIVIDKAGRVLVGDYHNNRVCILSLQGQHIAHIDLSQDGLGLPTGLALTPAGQLVVACSSPPTVYTVGIYQY